MATCKLCGKENNNGTNFCTRKCRLQWIRIHEIKGAKKRAMRRWEWMPAIIDYEGNCQCDNCLGMNELEETNAKD